MEVEVLAKSQAIVLLGNPNVDGFNVLEFSDGQDDFNKTLEHIFLSNDGMEGNFALNFKRECQEYNTLGVSDFDFGTANSARNAILPEGEGLQAVVAEKTDYILDSCSLNQPMAFESEVMSSDLPLILQVSDASGDMDLFDRAGIIGENYKKEGMDSILNLISDLSLKNSHPSVPISYLLSRHKNTPIQSNRSELGSAIMKKIEIGLAEHAPEFTVISAGDLCLTDLRLKFKIGPSTSVDFPIFDDPRLDQSALLNNSRDVRLDRMHAPMISKEKVVYQVATALADCAFKADGNVVELLLAPKELGACRFRMVLNGSRLEVDLAVDNPNVLQLMRRQVDILIFELKAAGFNQTSINFSEMKNGDTGFSQSRRDDHAAHGGFDPDVEPDAGLTEVVRQNSTAGRLHLKL